LVFAVMMIYFGYLLCRLQVESNQTTLILQIPTVYLYAILPLLGVIMLVRIVIITMTELRVNHSPTK